MTQIKKRIKYEGNPYSKWVQATQEFGRNETSTLTHGTITSPPPAIKLQIDNDPVEYDAGDIYIAQYLTAHKRIADISGIVIASSMTANGMGPHTHEITSVTLKDAVLSFTDELKAGDRVLVECDDENMKYTIVDRVVSYA